MPITRHLIALIASALCVSPAAVFAADAPTTPDAPRPNVLFIAIDDLRPELGAYGSRAITPHIDRLARTGLRFDRAYCNQAVCGASRLSLMTGLYPEFTGERTFHVTDWRKRWPKVVTLNQHFTAHGYTTVGLGKVYHGTAGPGVDPDNWTRWISTPGPLYLQPASLEAAKTNNRRRGRGPATEAADVADDAYADGQRAALGADQIRKLAKADQPFFLAVGFTKPHLPFNAPTKYWDLYDRADFKMPPNLGVPPGYPDYARNANAGELRSYADIPEKGSPADFPDALNQRLIHGYHACVSYTDRNVGLLLDTLDEAGIADRTIVVLWADHGWKLGDHSSWCKHTNFEIDTRVPLILRHPAMPSATGSTQALVELIDLYPTLCDLASIPKPAHLQGTSLLPILKDPTTTVRTTAYSSYPHGNLVGHSLRTPTHRYTEWWPRDSDKPDAVILTNLAQDPGETTAVTDDAELKKQLASELRARVSSARKDRD